MSIAEIAALDVPAEDNAHLFLWTTDGFLLSGDAARVVEAWGFTRPRLLVWEKTGFGLGTFPRPQHEQCVVAIRGSLAFQRRDVGSVHRWKLVYGKGSNSAVRKHSGKPDGFYDLVREVSPGPYLEMFARVQRLGWDTWGNEALQHVEIPENVPG
jgi:N6-adenosine-specific RNA methylase IME4